MTKLLTKTPHKKLRRFKGLLVQSIGTLKVVYYFYMHYVVHKIYFNASYINYKKQGACEVRSLFLLL